MLGKKLIGPLLLLMGMCALSSAANALTPEIKAVQVVLTAAQINKLNAIPINVIDGTPGELIKILHASFEYKFNAKFKAKSASPFQLVYTGTTKTIGVFRPVNLQTTTNSFTEDFIPYKFPIDTANIIGSGISIRSNLPAPTALGGTGTIKLTVYYYLVS